MQLRDYQQRAVDEVFIDDANVCLVSPTGSGKTTMGVAAAHRYGGRIGWIAHRRELVNQARERLLEMGCDVAFVTTVQSLETCECDFLVIDEAHHYPGTNDWSRILEQVTYRRMLGLTATPARSDGKGLSGTFDRLVVAANYSELLKAGHIAPCVVHAGPDIVGALSMHPVKAWRRWAPRRLTIGFAPGIPEAQEWTAQMNAVGIRAAYVTGETPDDERSALLAAFARAEITVLWNVYVLTEGVDIPQISCVLLARSFEHPSTYLQCVGRGLRTHRSKSDCVVIDLAGAWRLHGMPTDDRAYDLGKKPIKRGKVQKVHQCLQCGGICKITQYKHGRCPICGHEQPSKSMPVKIYDEQLASVWDGRETAEHDKDAALKRMRAEQLAGGYSLKWLRDTYKAQFGINPVIRDATDEEKARAWDNLKFTAIRSGRKLGWAAAIFKSQFGTPPSGFSWSQSR